MLKTKKKRIKSLAILLALILTLGFSPTTNVEAKAAPRLNYRKVTLIQGKKKRLKVRNLKKGRKIKWYSTKKSVATVNKKGIVKAKKKGKTYIVAKVGKKKYRCKVIVKKKKVKKKSSKKTTTKKPSASVKKKLYSDNVYISLSAPSSLAKGTTVDFFTYLSAGSKAELTSIADSIRINYYKWYSSDSSILSFNKKGIATGKKVGSVKVYCKYLTKSGKWNSTITVKAKVVDGGNVKFSYTLSLEDSPFNNPEYSVWDYAHESPIKPNPNEPKFNTITVKIHNNSSKSIRLDSVGICVNTIPREIYFETSNMKTIYISSHTSKEIKYYANYAFGSLDQEVSSNFVIDKKVFTGIYFNYCYKKTRMCAEYLKKSNSWKIFNLHYLTRKEFAEDNPYQ